MPEALPSLSPVQREAAKQFNPLSDGEFAFDQLSVHLKSYNVPRIVSISEDATRVITRIEYDPNSNKLVGFVLQSTCLLVDHFWLLYLIALNKCFHAQTKLLVLTYM